MSRGRTGLIKAIKEVFREVKFFGDAEIATLRKELAAHKVQLEQLKAARQERQRREEALALLEMRKAVEHLQKMEGLLAEQDQRLEAAAEVLTRKAQAKQERDMTARAMSVVQGMRVQDMLLAEEETLQQHIDALKARVETELEAAGKGQPSPSGGSGGGGGGKAAGKRR